jgi:hypothetical protein
LRPSKRSGIMGITCVQIMPVRHTNIGRNIPYGQMPLLRR